VKFHIAFQFFYSADYCTVEITPFQTSRK